MRRYAIISLVTLALASGCRSTAPPQAVVKPPAVSLSRSESASTSRPPTASSRGEPSIHPVAFQETLPEPETIPAPGESNIEPADEVRLQEFVADVVARHPSVQAMVAAWQAAAQRYPQVIALDDPMFMVMTAPGSLNSSTTEGAYVLELRQKLPWFGKRSLRGNAALEEAAAAGHDVQDARLKIALIAQLAYLEYFLADQQLKINEQNLGLMKEFRETAQVRYRTNLVTQQDVLQADVELADLDRRKLELRRMKRVAGARMNTLLLRAPDMPLPTPALEIIAAERVTEDTALLHSWALQNRPDLAALAHRVELETVNVELAYKQFHPDIELFGRYDTFWQPASTQGPLRGQVGVSTSLPIYRRKLNAAVSEAQFRLQRQRAEYEQLANDIRLEVQTAWEQVQESQQALDLYRRRLVPASEQYLAAARSNYEVGKATFLDIVQAQRQLVMAREKQIEATATLAQRAVELERSVGGSLPVPAAP